jgi:C4-dicarboxylate transporter DctQ subunit
LKGVVGVKSEDHQERRTDTGPAWQRLGPLVFAENWAAKVETGLNFLGACLIAFIMFFASAGIVLRYVFNAPIYGKVEIIELVMAGVVFFGLAYTQRIGGHVRMSFVIERYLWGRNFHMAESLTLILSLLTFAVITVATLDSTLYDLQIRGTTSNLYLPTWPSKMCIPVGSFFLCIRLAIQTVKHLAQVVAGGRREL